ncbi:alpha/beta fold hydrolase [Sutcliffiella sp. NC1]|uniref:alpha/beta fold hydrolase n=1 Tax=Sutcliffiella sp. NC1 TaxID=3004096 RepID=UPI0022DDC3E4|nr:alpha/beta hydrolase [Sutcliffiella sp. NC1]WBL17168.1 alpha/beta hydrolase [Sutcliffiella sp. NC1]
MILHTTIAGEGEPLVLIHSGGMTGFTEYEEQSEFFCSKGYKVIRPDLRGHGKSVGPIDHYFSHSADDILDTLDSLNIVACHIAGVSIGGIAALLFAKKYPNRVLSVCFSGIFPIKPDNWEELTKDEAERYEEHLFKNEEVVTYLNQIHGENDWRSLLRSFNEKDFYPFEEIADVAELNTPALCLIGEEKELEVSATNTFKEMNQHIHLGIIPFAGHLVHRDQPDLYSQMLLTFIKSTHRN